MIGLNSVFRLCGVSPGVFFAFTVIIYMKFAVVEDFEALVLQFFWEWVKSHDFFLLIFGFLPSSVDLSVLCFFFCWEATLWTLRLIIFTSSAELMSFLFLKLPFRGVFLISYSLRTRLMEEGFFAGLKWRSTSHKILYLRISASASKLSDFCLLS